MKSKVTEAAKPTKAEKLTALKLDSANATSVAKTARAELKVLRRDLRLLNRDIKAQEKAVVSSTARRERNAAKILKLKG